MYFSQKEAGYSREVTASDDECAGDSSVMALMMVRMMKIIKTR